MVKGNKFKPKPPPAPEPEAAAAAAAQPAAEAVPPPNNSSNLATAAGDVNGARKRKQNKAKRDRPAQQRQPVGQQGMALPPAAHPATLSGQQQAKAASGSVEASRPAKPPKKKRKLTAAGSSSGGDGSNAAAVLAIEPAKPPAPLIPTIALPVPPKSVAAAGVGSNWAALKSALAQQQQQQKPRRRLEGGAPYGGKHSKQRGREEGRVGDDSVEDAKPSGKAPQSVGSGQGLTKLLAIDCEMVGVGPDGTRSALARVCVVNSTGNVVLDTYVRPKEAVTDYRTKVSGIRPSHLQGAPDFDSVQKRVGDALRGRVVVGHALTNDLKVLLLGHPRKDIRDTSRYPPLMQTQGRKLRPRALRHLAQEQLGLAIQAGEHNPVDDARAALYLYLRHRKEWERWLAQGGKPPRTELPQGARGKPLRPHPAQPACAPKMRQALEQLAKNDYMADL